MAKDRALSSASAEQTGGIPVDENEFKTVFRDGMRFIFNEEKGAARWHRTRKCRDSAGQQLKVWKAGNDTVTSAILLIMLPFEDRVKPSGETNDNEGHFSNSLTALEAKPLSEAIADGWFSEGELVKADGSEAGTDTVQNEKSGMAVRSEGGEMRRWSAEKCFLPQFEYRVKRRFNRQSAGNRHGLCDFKKDKKTE